MTILQQNDKTLQENFLKISTNIQSCLSKNKIQRFAKATGLITRSSAKLSGSDILFGILSSNLDPTHSFLERISVAISQFNKNEPVTSQSLMERINRKESTDFFRKIFNEVFKSRFLDIENEVPHKLFSSFTKVLLQDSTTFVLHESLQEHFKGSGGRASKSSGKIDAIFDYKTKNYEHFEFTDVRKSDASLGCNITQFLAPKVLVIRDLGYHCVDRIKDIYERQAYFLSRLKLSVLVYSNKDDDTPFDLARYLSQNCSEKGFVDIKVYITKDKLPVRLVAFKAPVEVANERRREAKKTAKKQGRNLKEKTLVLMSFSIFITNVPAETWDAKVIGTI